MTAEEVIMLADRNARERGLAWTLTEDQYIVLNVPGKGAHKECPLEVAAGTGFGLCKALARLGLRESAAGAAVYRAADVDLNYNQAVRALMLATFDFGQGSEAAK